MSAQTRLARGIVGAIVAAIVGPAAFGQEDVMTPQQRIEHTEKLIVAARELREQFLNDPQRPAYHFTAPAGWMNDINGPIMYKGRYHIFYQHHPDAAYWHWMQWGHASSTDFVHWVHHPIALTPTPGGPDRDGCFSGGAVVNDGVPTVVYHGVPDGTCLATSTDDLLIHWTKHPANPVLRVPQPGEPGHGVYQVYDPCAWKRGDDWYLLCGGRAQEGGDTGYLFRSKDMTSWEYLRPFYQSRREWTDPYEDCAVPTFLPLGDRHLLLFVSHKLGAQYYLGRYEGDEFIPETHGRMNFPGGQFIAPIGMVDDQGRCLLFGWVCEARRNESVRAAGWAGVMTMPRILSLAEDGTLRIRPIPEVERLRLDEQSLGDVALQPPADRVLDSVSGDCLEIIAEIEPGAASQVGLRVRRSPDAAEQTTIVYDPAAGTLSVDTSTSSLGGDVVQPWPCPWGVMYDNPLESRVLPFHDAPVPIEDIRIQPAPLRLAPDAPLRLHVFLDRSILEVFANERQCITQRIYPSRADSLGVAAFAVGGEATMRSIRAWRLAPAGV